MCILSRMCAGLGAGMALGMVMQLPEDADEHSVSRRQLLAKLDVCMGGRAAEEMIFGESDVTTGASSDLQQVRPLGCRSGALAACTMCTHPSAASCRRCHAQCCSCTMPCQGSRA